MASLMLNWRVSRLDSKPDAELASFISGMASFIARAAEVLTSSDEFPGLNKSKNGRYSFNFCLVR
ncbi:hypothetical protein D3C74_459780 [compost metagenome]